MITKFVDVKTSDGLCDSFVAYPKEATPYPAVMLFMDAFGVRKYLYEMAETLAAQGYFVFVPNCFYRSKRAPTTDAEFPLTREKAMEVLGQILPMARAITDDQRKSDTKAFLEFLSSQKQVNAQKIATTGYCMGGTMALRSACFFPDKIKAAASFHAGHLVTDLPESTHLLLKNATAEIYVAHADHDPSMPSDKIEIFNSTLKSYSFKSECETYKGALHGFSMKDLPAYNEPGLKKHWEKLSALFSRALK